MSNYCYNPTSDFDVRTRSSTKSNNHMCTPTRAGASHSLPSKQPFRASKYNPNSRGLRGQPCFTACWHLKLEVTPSLGWLMCIVSLAYITCRHCKKHPPKASQHLPQHFTWHNIKCLFEIYKTTIEWFLFCLVLFYQSSQYEELVSSAIIFVKPSLTLST
jgi:hypothetical protein